MPRRRKVKQNVRARDCTRDPAPLDQRYPFERPANDFACANPAADPGCDLVYHDRPHHHELAYQLSGAESAIYSRIRSFLPEMGGIDLAPLVALIEVYAARIILINNAQYL